MIKRPPPPSKLIWDDDWLKFFCTYNQKREILLWAYQHRDLRPFGIEIQEGEEARNRIIVHFNGGRMAF